MGQEFNFKSIDFLLFLIVILLKKRFITNLILNEFLIVFDRNFEKEFFFYKKDR